MPDSGLHGTVIQPGRDSFTTVFLVNPALFGILFLQNSTTEGRLPTSGRWRRRTRRLVLDSAMRVQGIFPLTLTLSPEYRGEGTMIVTTLRSIPAVISYLLSPISYLLSPISCLLTPNSYLLTPNLRAR